MAWSPLLWMALVVLALAAFTAWLLVSGTARARAGQRQALGTMAFVLAAVGIAVAGREVYAGYQTSVAVATPLTNPFPGSPESIGRGQALFSTSCVVCHGVQGRGDGPLARTLRPPPADLRTHIEAGHTDAQLFGFISDGVPGTAMPAWKEQLTAEQRWDLVNYVKTFGGAR